MQREIKITSDGSTTIYLPDLNESYHSKHGALQEANHVFIKNGLDLFTQDRIAILEIGFGTGLNALVTFVEAEKKSKHIDYTGVEAFPVLQEEAFRMNYVNQINSPNLDSIFKKIHKCDWEEKNQLTQNFSLIKLEKKFEDINDFEKFDLIYFDAFGYNAQPNLWSEFIFKKMFNALKKNGVLVTYACRTSIKNAMLSSGFSVEKLPGAPGKREMLRAQKK
ncbi:MAG: tRNA (5-methylaminomethyl-2-thiouridine)(34)-methyltransferase MnmD [Flavobacterium sp.]|nr:tRNA (5-methylaminomethyl-2-thiouridine)(34)-methyltransferase MnmD [Flavobacterium sp.]